MPEYLQTDNLSREIAIVEAVLFLEGEAIDLKSISNISGLSTDVVLQAIDKLKQLYEAPSHGLEITEIGGGYLLSPKRVLWENLKHRYGKRNEDKLSRAAIETLSIIAYSQPITKSEIESIRGVSADNMIRLLLQKNLIKELGKKDVPGKPFQYGTTKEFLKKFRLNSISDLPKLDEIEQERFELEG